MRWLTVLLVAVASYWSANPVYASGLKVTEGVVTTGIIERAPVDAIQIYPVTVGKLFCFTEVVGATEETTITHVWYFGNTVTTRSVLPVRSAYWRTWSATTVSPEWVGEWRVEVLDAKGNLLLELPFTLTRN